MSGLINGIELDKSYMSGIIEGKKEKQINEGGLIPSQKGESDEGLIKGQKGESDEGLIKGQKGEFDEGLIKGQKGESDEGLIPGQKEENNEGKKKGKFNRYYADEDPQKEMNSLSDIFVDYSLNILNHDMIDNIDELQLDF